MNMMLGQYEELGRDGQVENIHTYTQMYSRAHVHPLTCAHFPLHTVIYEVHTHTQRHMVHTGTYTHIHSHAQEVYRSLYDQKCIFPHIYIHTLLKKLLKLYMERVYELKSFKHVCCIHCAVGLIMRLHPTSADRTSSSYVFSNQ